MANIRCCGSEEAQWNAKLRLGGDIIDSQFVELDGKENVSNEVLRATGMKTKLEDLRVFADLQTRRASWEVTQLADGTKPEAKMTIVVDEVTEAGISENRPNDPAFSHTVGEVEMLHEFVTEGMDSAEHEACRKKIGTQRMEELKGFMMSNPDLFTTTPKPIGKLSAYDSWKNSCS